MFFSWLIVSAFICMSLIIYYKIRIYLIKKEWQ